MQLKEVVSTLQLTVLTGQGNLEAKVTGGYASDLLSNVMGQAETGNIWVTMQGHQNVVAVASLAGLSAILIAGGVEPEKDALDKAAKESIVILTTTLSSFEAIGRLYGLGIAGQS